MAEDRALTRRRIPHTDSKFTCWAGLSPGNNESAGKRKNVKIVKGNKCLKAVVTEVSWACIRTKDTYLRTKFYRLARRRGKKHAICALNRTNGVILYHMLKDKSKYADLGIEYYKRLNPERSKKYYIKKLEQLGTIFILLAQVDIWSVTQ